MKRISILIGLVAVLSIFNSCDKDMPYDLDEISRGALIDVSKIEGTDLYIDALAVETPSLGMRLQMVPEGEGSFDYLQLVVVYNRDVSYIVGDNITALPTEITVDMDQVLDLIGNDWVAPGESYDFTVNVVLDNGMVIKGWSKETGFNNTPFSGWRFEGRPYSSAARYAVQCSFQYEEWDSDVNDFLVDEMSNFGPATYPVTLEHLDELPDEIPDGVDAENLRGLVIYDLWSGGSATRVWVNIADFSMVIPDQNVLPDWDPDVGSIWFEDALPTAGVSTCDNIMEFNVTPTLPESGLWWGTDVTFTIYIDEEKSTKDSNISVLRINDREIIERN